MNNVIKTAEDHGFTRITDGTVFPEVPHYRRVIVVCLAAKGLPTVMITTHKYSRWDGAKRYKSFADAYKKSISKIEYFKL